MGRIKAYELEVFGVDALARHLSPMPEWGQKFQARAWRAGAPFIHGIDRFSRGTGR